MKNLFYQCLKLIIPLLLLPDAIRFSEIIIPFIPFLIYVLSLSCISVWCCFLITLLDSVYFHCLMCLLLSLLFIPSCFPNLPSVMTFLLSKRISFSEICCLCILSAFVCLKMLIFLLHSWSIFSLGMELKIGNIFS